MRGAAAEAAADEEPGGVAPLPAPARHRAAVPRPQPAQRPTARRPGPTENPGHPGLVVGVARPPPPGRRVGSRTSPRTPLAVPCSPAPAIRLFYKGTLKILLVLLHDFPEFLCSCHFSFCDVIPPTCIQMRNVILSSFPGHMRLPDPFTPNLKVSRVTPFCLLATCHQGSDISTVSQGGGSPALSVLGSAWAPSNRVAFPGGTPFLCLCRRWIFSLRSPKPRAFCPSTSTTCCTDSLSPSLTRTTHTHAHTRKHARTHTHPTPSIFLPPGSPHLMHTSCCMEREPCQCHPTRASLQSPRTRSISIWPTAQGPPLPSPNKIKVYLRELSGGEGFSVKFYAKFMKFMHTKSYTPPTLHTCLGQIVCLHICILDFFPFSIHICNSFFLKKISPLVLWGVPITAFHRSPWEESYPKPP